MHGSGLYETMGCEIVLMPIRAGSLDTAKRGRPAHKWAYLWGIGVSGKHLCLPSRWGGFESHISLQTLQGYRHATGYYAVVFRREERSSTPIEVKFEAQLI